MVSFEQAVQTAETVIRGWREFPSMKEITIIRDVFGHLAFLLSAGSSARVNNRALTTLKADLRTALGVYFSGRVICQEARHSDLEARVIANIQSLRQLWKISGACSWYYVERVIAKKAWLDRSGTVSPIWSYDDACDGNKPKVLTFYSFKGGMGRTTALAASAMILAQKGKTVLAVDTDVEAPGLFSIFFDDGQIQMGTVDFLVEYQADPSYAPDMREYLTSVDGTALKAEIEGDIYVIPAGKMDEQYLSKLARIDYQDTTPNGMRSALCRLIEQAVSFIESFGKPVDYVLLDARAGFHDMGGVITVQIPHGIVLLGRDNPQSWNGMKEVIRLAASAQADAVPIAIVDSMHNGFTGTSQQRESFKIQAYTLCCDGYYMDEVPGIDADGEAHSPIYVSYQPQLNDEVRLYSDGSAEQNEMFQTMKNILSGPDYQAIVSRICGWFGDDLEEGNNEHD